jgi:tRNA uridine 5-carbamoylmethylation protein Kti12
MIIFINGSINSGKSTIAKILSQKIKKSALIEIDSLRDFIDWMPLKESIPINLENTVSIIKNFIARNINVIVPYPISQDNYDYLIDNLKDIEDKIIVFTLNPDLDVVLKNRGERELTDWEKERIKYHYSIKINNPSFGEIIDNTNQKPAETAQIIFCKIKSKLQ